MSQEDLARPGAAAYLEGALQVSALAQAGASDVLILRAVAEAIASRLGFGTVVLNTYRPASDDFVAAECVGSQAARTALLGTTTRPSDWEPLLRAGRRAGGTCFVAAGTLDWDEDPVPSYIPPLSGGPDGPDAWDAEDALFVPLRDSTGDWLGIVSVDEPASRRRPADEDLTVLGAFCAHLAHTLELARLRTSDERRAKALACLVELAVSTHLSEDADAALCEIAEAVAKTLGHRSVEIRDRARRLAHVGADDLPALEDTALEQMLAGDGRARARRLADGTILCPLRSTNGELVGVLRTSAEWFGVREEPGRLALVTGFANLAQAVMASASHEALQRSEARKDAILSSALDAIVTVDAGGAVTDFNPAAEAMFGLPASEALGQDALTLMFPPDTRPDPRHAARQIDHDRSETVAHRADESRFLAEVAAVRTDTGTARLHTVFLRDVTERAEARRQLERQRDAEHHAATHDTVTGLLNREGLREQGAALGSLVGRTLVKVSLDDLGPVHEGFGQAVGTSLTQVRAAKLAQVAASAGPLARTGDHTFAMLCPSAEVDVMAREMQATAAEPFTTDGLTLLSSISVGLAEAEGPGDTVDDLLRRADVARRHSRRAGGVPTPYRTGDDTVQERLRAAAALRAGIDADELELHYQPLLSVEHREIVGFEALVRWRTADGSLVPPGDFIPMAERTGLIAPIGAWVVGEACRQAARWRAAGLTVPTINVNVSPYQIAHHDVAEIVATALDVHGLEPVALCVEVTEAALNTAPEGMQRLLADLGGIGVRRSLDDFGADFSSLSRLVNLDVDGVKLDRSFLRRVPDDARATALLRSIVQVVKAVGMATTAEGVERAEQMEELVFAGVDVAQGFLLGRPVPAAETEMLLRTAAASSPVWVAGIA